MLNVQDLIRDWCAATGYPLPDLKGRARAAREAGFISQKGFGKYAAHATVRDGYLLLLAILTAQFWKDVPSGIRRYESLVLTWANHSLDIQGANPPPFPFEIGKSTLTEALSTCLMACAIRQDIEMSSLQVVRSETNPAAYLSIRVIKGGGVPGEVAQLRFTEPRLPLEDRPREAFTVTGEIHDYALTAMAKLLTPYVEARIAEAFRTAEARKVPNETGPSALTDEPGPMLSNTLIDRHGAPTPQRRTGS